MGNSGAAQDVHVVGSEGQRREGALRAAGGLRDHCRQIRTHPRSAIQKYSHEIIIFIFIYFPIRPH